MAEASASEAEALAEAEAQADAEAQAEERLPPGLVLAQAWTMGLPSKMMT